MHNYKMIVQYDGTRYSGWQRQGNTSATVQNRIEQALATLLKEPAEVSGSGRTDSGVHALGQVANFRTEQFLRCGEFRNLLNDFLPDDVYVTDLRLAGERFHARLSAKEKIYRYTIENGHNRDIFRRRYVFHLADRLDIRKMQAAAELLLGTHDFAGFSTGHTKKTTVRHLSALDIRREGDNITLTFRGNGFLYNMVRILTGTLIEVGMKKREPESVLTVLETKERGKAGFTAPPQGLCLMEVIY